MKITNIRYMKLLGPLHHACGGASSMIAKIIVRVDTDCGLYGLGEVDDFAGVKDALDYIREYLKGRDPFQITPIVSEMIYGSLPPHHSEAKTKIMKGNIIPCPSMSPTATSFGPIVWAVSGVEMALCDLMGKALKTPVYNLLGGKYRDKIRIYLDRSSPADVQNPDAWRKMSQDVIEAGFTQMKFDIDYVASDICSDIWNRSLSLKQINVIVKRLGLVRETAGDDFEICVDCHMHYNLPDAIRLAEALKPLNLLWFEDPLPILNVDAYRMLREKTSIPLCVGEMFTAEQFRLFISQGACDVLHPDIMFCGGCHEMKRISTLAELNYLPMAIHGNGGALSAVAAAHVAASCRNFYGLEYHFIETPWIGDIVQRDIPLFKDGHLSLTDAPGFGVELNEEVCQKYIGPGEAMF